MDIQQFRELNPNFKSIGDKELSQKLYNTYYADKMDFDAFDRQFRPLAYKYDALDKAKYIGRAAGEGLTFGLGDIVGGVTNAVVAPIGKTVNSFVEGTPLTANDFNPWQNFKEGRTDFVREQNAFKEAHPALDFAGELGGGLITGIAGAGKKLATTAGKQGLKALANEGAREGAKFGMAYGAGSGLTQEEDKISVPNALIGAGVGGAGGAVLGGVLAPVSKVASSTLTKTPITVQEAKNAALRRLVEQNPELVQKSISEGTPLINIADKKLFRTTRGAVSSDAEAEQILSDYARKFNADKFDKVEGLINQQLGETSSFGAVQNILEQGKKVYKPIYDEVMKVGEIDLPREIIADQTILRAMQEAQTRAGYTGYKANDVRVLDKAKRILQDKYRSLNKAGKADEAMEYQIAKEKLVGFMDEKVPNYSKAREAFKDTKDLEDLVAQGQSVKKLTRDELATLYAKTAPEERGAIKAGIRDVMVGDLDRINSEGANAIKKVFSPSMLRKLERIGLADDKISQAIAAEDLANANIQGVFGGSNTAQKIADILNNTQEGVSVGRAIFQPMRTAKRYGIKSVDYLVNKMQNSSPAETARLMTDPQYLKSEYNRVFGKVAKVLNQTDKPANPANRSIGQIIKGKLKEKGGYAMKDKGVNQILNSEGNPVATTEEGVKNFGKFFKGSKVVDENGNPLVVYHGTANDFNTFDKSKVQMPMFWFTADKKSLYDGRTSTNAKGGVKKVMETYLDIKNPANSDQYENFTIEQLKARGFDGIKLTKKDGYSSDMYVAFEPNQIKSVKNQGTFDPKNPNIYKGIVGGLGISQILKNKEAK